MPVDSHLTLKSVLWKGASPSWAATSRAGPTVMQGHCFTDREYALQSITTGIRKLQLVTRRTPALLSSIRVGDEGSRIQDHLKLTVLHIKLNVSLTFPVTQHFWTNSSRSNPTHTEGENKETQHGNTPVL